MRDNNVRCLKTQQRREKKITNCWYMDNIDSYNIIIQTCINRKRNRQRQLNFLLHGQSGELLQVGCLVGKIIILSFRTGISKNKKYWSRLCMKAIVIHLHNSTLSNVLKFHFYLFHCNLKEKDHVRRNVNSKNKNIYKWNQYYYYFDFPKTRVSWVHTTKNYVAFPLCFS